MNSVDFEMRKEMFRHYRNGLPDERYFIDWDSVFTPIEKAVWIELQSLSLPFWPQYPISKFFVDFADPIKKIVIECDGKHHTREADRPREKIIRDLGWKIFRVTGAECLRAIDPQSLERDYKDQVIDGDQYLERMREYFLTTSTGVLSAISWSLYGIKPWFFFEKFMSETLDLHDVESERCPAPPINI